MDSKVEYESIFEYSVWWFSTEVGFEHWYYILHLCLHIRLWFLSKMQISGNCK